MVFCVIGGSRLLDVLVGGTCMVDYSCFVYGSRLVAAAALSAVGRRCLVALDGAINDALAFSL